MKWTPVTNKVYHTNSEYIIVFFENGEIRRYMENELPAELITHYMQVVPPFDESSSSVEEDRETKRQPIEDALYATKRFLTTEATDLADGILDYLNDHGFTVTKSIPVTGDRECEAIGERKFTLKEALELWDDAQQIGIDVSGGKIRTTQPDKRTHFLNKFGINL